MSAVPARVGDRFELGEKIGAGSLSTVYAAVDSITGQEVAVKLACKRVGRGVNRHLDWQQGGAEREFLRLGDVEGHVWALLNRGAISYYGGDVDGSRTHLDAAFSLSVGARFQEGIAWSLNLLGLVSLTCGELLQARARLYASLRVHRRLGDLWRCASVMEGLAAVAAHGQAAERAALYLGAADSVRARIGVPVPPCEQTMVATAKAYDKEALGHAFDAAYQRGRRQALDEIVALASELL